MRKKIPTIVWRPLAAIYLALSWLWDKMASLIARFFSFLPIQPIKDAIARFYDKCPPWLALMSFLAPLAIVEQLHLTVFYFMAKGHFAIAILDSITLRLLQLGLVAFLFDQGRDKFLQIGWFKKLYAHLIYWRHRARELIHPWLQRLKQEIAHWREDIRRRGLVEAFKNRRTPSNKRPPL